MFVSRGCFYGEPFLGALSGTTYSASKKGQLRGIYKVISAEVNGARVAFKLKKLSEKSTQVTISARKFGLPQVEVASGIMYRLSEQLK